MAVGRQKDGSATAAGPVRLVLALPGSGGSHLEGKPVMRLGMKHIVVAALAVCAVTGCSLATDNTTSGPTTTAGATDAQGKIGQELTVTDPTGASARATVVSVADHPTGKSDTDLAPTNGQYAVITVQITGVRGSFDVNLLNVQYLAQDGKSYDATAGNGVASGYDPQLPSGPVQAGAATGGVVVVDVPAGGPKDIKLTDDLGTVLGTWTP